MKNTPLILVTNDDGVEARGIHSLIEAVSPLGDVVVVAPDGPRSAQSNAITVNSPLRFWKHLEKDGLTVYRCNGTTTDCVKLALCNILDRMPDIIVSGINHGSNSSASVMYSGTMGGVFEGCRAGIPSIGFSLCNYDPRADFTVAMKYAYMLTETVLVEGLPKNTCLNVNVPPLEEVKGYKLCRQADGYWHEKFVKREDPYGNNYYWLTGNYVNNEPQATDTDEAMMAQGYVSVVPCKIDLTDYEALKELEKWNYEEKI